MNDKFFLLPEEKQQRILNAAYRVFSQNSYKKSPMSEIAAEAGISKSLLFHYFHNKQELYLYLWEKSGEVTISCLREYGCYEQRDLFDMMYRGMQAKLQIMRQYPFMGAFAIKAFYEKDPEVSMKIQESYRKLLVFKAKAALVKLDPRQFIPGLDLEMMYREMYLASEGYLWEMVQADAVDVKKMEEDFTRMIAFWKQIYMRKESEEVQEKEKNAVGTEDEK